MNDANPIETPNEEPLGEEQESSGAQSEAEANTQSVPELLEKISELEDTYLRMRADFENTKKRLEREKSQALEYAYEKIASDLLPVVDTLEMALKSVGEESEENRALQEKFIEGLKLTLDNFTKVLQRHGIETIPGEGEFDPHLHECIMQVSSESHKAGEIVQIFQTGYRYKERILRPAMVSVAKID